MNNIDKIELNLGEKFTYYRLSIILSIVAVLCFYSGISDTKNYSISEILNTSNKIGLILILLALVFFIIREKALKFKKRKLLVNANIFKAELNKLIEKQKWKINSKTKNNYVIETDRNGMDGMPFLSRSWGEIIYVNIQKNEIYIKSIFDLKKNYELTISSGENESNEKLILNLIKPAANNV